MSRGTVTHSEIRDNHQTKALLILPKVSFPKRDYALPPLTLPILLTTVSQKHLLPSVKCDRAEALLHLAVFYSNCWLAHETVLGRGQIKGITDTT